MTNIMVIRKADVFSRLMLEAGFEVSNLELIQTEVIGSEFDNIGSYDGLFFTSPVAAAAFIGSRVTFGGKIYVLGSRTQAAFEKAGFAVESKPEAKTAEELIKAFGADEFSGKRLLFVRGDRSMRTVTHLLAADEMIVYKTIEVEPSEDERQTILTTKFDWIAFFSPSGVDAYHRQFGTSDAIAAAIGNTTANRARELDFNVGFISRRSSAEDFAEGLIEYIRN